jgi:hypothetical protein
VQIRDVLGRRVVQHGIRRFQDSQARQFLDRGQSARRKRDRPREREDLQLRAAGNAGEAVWRDFPKPKRGTPVVLPLETDRLDLFAVVEKRPDLGRSGGSDVQLRSVIGVQVVTARDALRADYAGRRADHESRDRDCQNETESHD